MAVATASSVFNFNVGILGHVDSGKTSLAKALSTTASTAAFDKNPQSQERGITLDLGFSSFAFDTPSSLIERNAEFAKYDKVQFTLVDCPGHASLIRTIIGGAQIIDLVLLVVDAQKGVQTQTAECLILAEITCPERMIVVLNKVDVFAEDVRTASVEKMSKRLRKTLENTKYKDAPIIPTSSLNGAVQIDKLVACLMENLYLPPRDPAGPFLFAVDHCFIIKGQGTVMTGTVLSGSVKLNDNVEIASLKEVKKVKSMQIFRRPVDVARRGDRVGLAVTQFDAKLFERGLVSQTNYLHPTYGAVCSVQKIGYFKGKIETKSKFHISVGYETTLARCSFFGCIKIPCECSNEKFVAAQDFAYLDGLNVENDKENEEGANRPVCGHKYLLLEFDSPVLCPPNSLYIASRLEMDIHSNLCRLAFHGRLLTSFVERDYVETLLPTLKVFKWKERRGVVERMTDEYTLIVTGLFKKETNIDVFTNLRVSLTSGESGYIEGNFGQSGKAKIRIAEGLKKETVDILTTRAEAKKKSKKPTDAVSSNNVEQTPIEVILRFKRYVYDAKKTMCQ